MKNSKNIVALRATVIWENRELKINYLSSLVHFGRSAISFSHHKDRAFDTSDLQY